jgi:hypothetical protein
MWYVGSAKYNYQTRCTDVTRTTTFMLPFPAAVAATLAAIGAMALSRLLQREWQRVNTELDASGRAAATVARKDLPTLRRDPATGIYRPQ